MCGIVGYIGRRDATAIVLDGLKRLEYRGYDSAGLAVLHRGGLEVRRAHGKIAALADRLAHAPVTGQAAIGHTRWATHGAPSEHNAHPHRDCTGSIVVVHNGIVENHYELRAHLLAGGHRFTSETDTEVIAHLIEERLATGLDLPAAVRAAAREIGSAYALAVMTARDPDTVVSARRGPGGVILGLGDGETYLASDIAALLPHTRRVVVLEDDDLAIVRRDGVVLTGEDGRPVQRTVREIDWNVSMAQKDGYAHFMLKEIYEQPRAVRDTLRSRIDHAHGLAVLPEANVPPRLAERVRRVVLIACGTSYHAALLGRAMIERLTGLPAEVDVASEFRFRHGRLDPETLLVSISQSGETADTLGAVKSARALGVPVVGITNVVGSGLTREASGVIQTHAGPEIGVASTKTFVATAAACYLLAVNLGRVRGALGATDARALLREVEELPAMMEKVLALDGAVADLAGRLQDRAAFLFLGRGPHHAIALEGALKLKEISYIHAEGYAAGEMKHGPIALVDEGMVVVALTPGDWTRERMLGNVSEVRARGATTVLVGRDDAASRELAHHVVAVPAASELLAPLLSVVPLQLLAYHIARLRGLDVDQPRNLAKSVTVE